MKSVSGKDFTRILERHGWELLRMNGKPGVSIHISVPIHGNAPLKIGLLRHFPKTAGLTRADL